MYVCVCLCVLGYGTISVAFLARLVGNRESGKFNAMKARSCI